MCKNAKLDELLNNNKFNEAASLLKDHLAKAEIINPRNDKLWAPYADLISSKILEIKGKNAFYTSWNELLKFFENELEPTWGHLHKGHIFFKLSLAKIIDDVDKAKTFLEKALDEDRLLEMEIARGETDIVEKALGEKSSYVMLCIIERVEDEHFGSDAEKQKFFQQLLSPSFDTAIFGKRVHPEAIIEFIKLIVPEQMREQTYRTKRELDIVYAQRLEIATVSLLGVFLENILLSILYHWQGLRAVQVKNKSKDILEVELGLLLKEAITQAVFPSDSIKATCQIIHFFRNRLHPGNELRQKYKLTARVVSTLKNLFDLALFHWWLKWPEAPGKGWDNNV